MRAPLTAATLLEHLSRDAPQPQELRKQARAMAGRALELNPDDPMAQEALRNLENGGASLLRPIQPEAHTVLEQAETAFSSRRFDRRREAEGALLSGIAADPSQLPSWGKLAQLRAGAGLPLKRLGPYRGIKVIDDGKQGFEVQVNEDVGKQAGTPDGNFRMLLALAEIHVRSDARDHGKSAAPFDIELGAWRKALQDAAEARKDPKDRLADPALRQMLAFAGDGQLERPSSSCCTRNPTARPSTLGWRAIRAASKPSSTATASAPERTPREAH